VRLFVALDLPEGVRKALAEIIARLKSECRSLGLAKIRWVRPEGMHITLKFIGETERETLDSIRAALATVHSREPVEMNLRGVGFFPNERRPRVAWCGVEASANLADLAADAGRALEPLGFPIESRAYVPHLTLARFSSPDGLDKLVHLVNEASDLKAREFGSARETEFHLFESILKPSGAEYNRLTTFAFVENHIEKIAGNVDMDKS
jgi:2'-5' RNA ligase